MPEPSFTAPDQIKLIGTWTLSARLILGPTAQSLVAVNNAPPRQIVWAKLNRNPVAGKNTNEVLPHAPGDVSQNLVLVLELNLEHGIGQRFNYHRHYFNRVFLRQSIS